MNCPYCGSSVSIQDSKIVYGISDYGKIWLCDNYPECDVFVGAHKHDDKPKGTLANRQLRQWRKNAHTVFDPLWKSGKMSRSQAYKWLAQELGLPAKQTHIAMFDVDICQQVVKICMARKDENPIL